MSKQQEKNRFISENMFGNMKPNGTAVENYDLFVCSWGYPVTENGYEINVDDVENFINENK